MEFDSFILTLSQQRKKCLVGVLIPQMLHRRPAHGSFECTPERTHGTTVRMAFYAFHSGSIPYMRCSTCWASAAFSRRPSPRAQSVQTLEEPVVQIETPTRRS